MNGNPRNTAVLVVDDDPVFRQAARIVLAQTPGEWQTYEAASVQEAVALLNAGNIEYAIVDIHLPDGTALDIIRSAGAVPCLLCTVDDEEFTFRQIFSD